MEMCYNDALVMPKNYAVINEEEMMYLDGGAKKYVGYISANTCSRAAAVAAIGGGILTILCGAATVVSAIATLASCGTLAAGTAILAGITAVVGGGTMVISGYLWLASTYNGLNVYYDSSARYNKVSVSIRK